LVRSRGKKETWGRVPRDLLSAVKPALRDRPADPSDPRFLLYSHDGLGLGHTRRNLAIAAALRALSPDAPILLATGTDDAHRLGVPPGVDVLKVPGLRKVANGRYSARNLTISSEEVHILRSKVLAAAAKAFRPSVMLVDKHPLGPNGELRRAVETVRADGGHTVLGLRDILDDPATVLREWAPHDVPGQIAAYYDRILVYGHPSVFDPVRAYDFPAALARRTTSCGYAVAPPLDPPNPEDEPVAIPPRPHDRPLVLATAGGGEDGFFLLEAFVRAATDAPWRGVAVCGPLMPPSDQAALRALAAECGVAFHGFVPGLSGYLGRADAIVSMGGYNTLAEACSRGLPVVCVPRTQPRREQWIRASAFERLGLLRSLRPEGLEPGALRNAIETALDGPRHTAGPVALPWAGAQRAAEELLRLATPTARLVEAIRA
jgi:predicted glycosyltransferase